MQFHPCARVFGISKAIHIAASIPPYLHVFPSHARHEGFPPTPVLFLLADKELARLADRGMVLCHPGLDEPVNRKPRAVREADAPHAFPTSIRPLNAAGPVRKAIAMHEQNSDISSSMTVETIRKQALALSPDMPDNEVPCALDSALDLCRPVLRVHVVKDTETRQSRRRAFHVIVVNHDFAKHFGRVDQLEKVPATRLLTSSVAACKAHLTDYILKSPTLAITFQRPKTLLHLTPSKWEPSVHTCVVLHEQENVRCVEQPLVRQRVLRVAKLLANQRGLQPLTCKQQRKVCLDKQIHLHAHTFPSTHLCSRPQSSPCLGC